MKNIEEIFEKIVKKFGNRFTALRWVYTYNQAVACNPIELIRAEKFDKIEEMLDTIQ